MLGYGLVNSEIHKFCLTELINNFFNRTTISKDGIVFFYYLLLRLKDNKLIELSLDGNADALYESDDFYKEYFKAMFEMFLSEEIFFSVKHKLKDLITGYREVKKEAPVTDLILNYEKIVDGSFGYDTAIEAQDVLYKYILSAILISDKDYPFDATTNAEVISHGMKQLQLFFNKLLLLFLENSQVIKDLKEGTDEFKKYKEVQTPESDEDTIALIKNLAKNNIFLSIKYKLFNDFLFLMQRRNYLSLLDKQIMVLENE